MGKGQRREGRREKATLFTRVAGTGPTGEPPDGDASRGIALALAFCDGLTAGFR